MKNAKVLSALGLMSLASTAALAASGPTLGSVLDASGVKVSGAVAASFRQNANNAQNNFQVDQALLSVAYQPKEGFGAVVDVASGDDLGLQGGNVSAGNNGTSASLTQAYLQYKTGALTVVGGRFYTAAGYEVFPVTGNLFVSRSLTFGTESTYHTGLRASYALNDTLSVNVGVHNGIYQDPTPCPCTADATFNTLKNKSAEVGVNWAPMSDLSVAFTHYRSKLEDDLFSLVATYNVTSDLSLALNADKVSGADATNLAFYATYALSDKIKAGLRLEELNPDGSGNNTGAVAAVVSYAAAKNFDIRTELSNSDKQGAGNKRSTAAAVQGVLKF